MISSYREILCDLKQKLGIRGLYASILLGISGVLEGVVFLSLYPLIYATFDNKAAKTGPDFMVNLDHYLKYFYFESEHRFLFFFLTCLMIYFTAALIQFRYAAHLQALYVRKWRTDLMQHLMFSSWLSLKKVQDGEVVNAITNSIGKLDLMVWYVFESGATLVNIAVFMVLALAVSFKVTGLMFVLGVLLVLLLKPHINAVSKIGHDLNQQTEDLNKWTINFLNGLKLIKISNAEAYVANKFESLNKKIYYSGARSFFASNRIGLVFQLSVLLFLVVLLKLSIKLFHSGFIETLYILGLFSRIYPKYASLSNQMYLIKSNATALDYVTKLMDKIPVQKHLSEITPLPSLKVMELKQVEISFGNKRVLSHLDMSIAKGELVVLLGESGSGKTTLIDGLVGLVPVSQGGIYWNDHLIENASVLREYVAYVSQEVVLFKGSVEENIRWKNKTLTDEDIINAAKRSNAHEFIEKLEGGYQYELQDRGGNLSGGQKQRLAIARALANRSCEVIVFDESTSALDTETESTILMELAKLKQQCAIIFITHRDSIIPYADKVYKLENGRVDLIPSGFRKKVKSYAVC